MQASLRPRSAERVPDTAHVALIAPGRNIWERGGFFGPYRVVYSSDNFIFISFAEILGWVQVTLGISPAGGIVVVVLLSL